MDPTAFPPRTRNWTPGRAGVLIGTICTLLLWLIQKYIIGPGLELPISFMLFATGIVDGLVDEHGKRFITRGLEILAWCFAGVTVAALFKHGSVYWLVGWIFLVSAFSRGHSIRIREWAENHA